jgi:hypothetical protein
MIPAAGRSLDTDRTSRLRPAAGGRPPIRFPLNGRPLCGNFSVYGKLPFPRNPSVVFLREKIKLVIHIM